MNFYQHWRLSSDHYHREEGEQLQGPCRDEGREDWGGGVMPRDLRTIRPHYQGALACSMQIYSDTKGSKASVGTYKLCRIISRNTLRNLLDLIKPVIIWSVIPNSVLQISRYQQPYAGATYRREKSDSIKTQQAGEFRRFNYCSSHLQAVTIHY